MSLETVLDNKDVGWDNSAACNILMTSYVTFVQALLNVRTLCCSRRPAPCDIMFFLVLTVSGHFTLTLRTPTPHPPSHFFQFIHTQSSPSAT